MVTQSTKKNAGFTLIELLVVIAIIGLLSSVVFASLSSARNRANDAKRLQDIRQVQRAVELFASDNNGQYPNTSGAWRSQCSAWGGHAAQNVIPGAIPNYLPALPVDPQMNTSANTCCYLYLSNGTDYGFMAYNCPTANYGSAPTLRSPLYGMWAVWSPGMITNNWI